MNAFVRPLELPDIPLIADYWANAAPDYLRGMGADPEKMPARSSFVQMLEGQLVLPYKEKQAYALIWEVDGRPVGHSNINNIEYGDSANMHLHLWTSQLRQKGLGTELVRLSLPFYFKHFDLKVLVCEPYAFNPAPNKTLARVGFTFIRRYTTVPGSINFEQEVNRWELSASKFRLLINT